MGAESAGTVSGAGSHNWTPVDHVGDAFATECKNADGTSNAQDNGGNAQQAATGSSTPPGTSTKGYIPPVHPRFAQITQNTAQQQAQDITSPLKQTATTEEPPQTPEETAEQAVDTATQGEELLRPEPSTLAPADPSPWTVDQRVAWNEQWLADALTFFADPLVQSLLTPDQRTSAQTALEGYQIALSDFKTLLEDYRSEGEEPPQADIDAAFGLMRGFRNELKGLTGIVVIKSVDIFDSAVNDGLFGYSINAFMDTSAASTVVIGDFQSVLTDMALPVYRDTRHGSFMDGLRWALSMLRDRREHPMEAFRPS